MTNLNSSACIRVRTAIYLTLAVGDSYQLFSSLDFIVANDMAEKSDDLCIVGIDESSFIIS